jgi:hypothetical protein
MFEINMATRCIHFLPSTHVSQRPCAITFSNHAGSFIYRLPFRHVRHRGGGARLQHARLQGHKVHPQPRFSHPPLHAFHHMGMSWHSIHHEPFRQPGVPGFTLANPHLGQPYVHPVAQHIRLRRLHPRRDSVDPAAANADAHRARHNPLQQRQRLTCHGNRRWRRRGGCGALCDYVHTPNLLSTCPVAPSCLRGHERAPSAAVAKCWNRALGRLRHFTMIPVTTTHRGSAC